MYPEFDKLTFENVSASKKFCSKIKTIKHVLIIELLQTKKAFRIPKETE